MVDYIANYLETIRTRPVFPNVSPGYLRQMVPDSAPVDGEPWTDIYKDIERVIMPGSYRELVDGFVDRRHIGRVMMTHWQSPHMHAYFPALNSFPSLLADMLADAIGCLGFTWASSPACTELEIVVMDWLAKMINLPMEFYHSNPETMGGGVIQTTASEATLVSILAARTEAIRRYRSAAATAAAAGRGSGRGEGGDKEENGAEGEEEEEEEEEEEDVVVINGRLVGYCSDQAHSSVEKAGLIGLVKMRLLPCDEELCLRGSTLREAINNDKRNGLIPFYLCATLGTTGACAFDKLNELGPICMEECMWMHIDAAYAGTAFICPEFQHFMSGVNYAQSFAFNPSKWMMVHFDCTAMWVKDSRALHRTFNVQPLYLRHENTGTAIDFMIPLSKRFRALKLWFVLRSFGVSGLQRHVREGVRLAAKFENLVSSDERFEVAAKRHLGLVAFRLKGDNNRTELLLRRLNSSGRVHMVPASLKGRYIIRFTVTSQYTVDEDIDRDWSIIQRMASKILSAEITATELPDNLVLNDQQRVEIMRRKREILKRKDFGLSLILSNVPMSPKFINGSFAAMFDSPGNDIISEYAKHISNKNIDLNGCPMRMSPRKKFEEKKRQISFDQSLLPKAAAAGLRSKTTRHSYRQTKQASLDSKIEEIFENSVTQGGTVHHVNHIGGTAHHQQAGVGGAVLPQTSHHGVNEGMEQMKISGRVEEQEEEVEEEGAREGETEEGVGDVHKGANGLIKIGSSTCRHCGSDQVE